MRILDRLKKTKAEEPKPLHPRFIPPPPGHQLARCVTCHAVKTRNHFFTSKHPVTGQLGVSPECMLCHQKAVARAKAGGS